MQSLAAKSLKLNRDEARMMSFPLQDGFQRPDCTAQGDSMEPETQSNMQDAPVAPVTTPPAAAGESAASPVPPAAPHFSVPPGPSFMQ
jgi:hypothetical protein